MNEINELLSIEYIFNQQNDEVDDLSKLRNLK
jgi:hypothetical protein